MTETRRPLVAMLVAAVLLGAGCQATSSRPPATTPATPAAGSRGAERHTHENLNAVLWMQTSAEYRASTIQAYRLARLQLDAALADPRWTAAIEQTGDAAALPPAVVLDLDETVLDNSAFQAREVRDSAPYSDAAWARWVEERKAGLIPGALDFLEYARSRGVAPIYVTNRDHAGETATRDVLETLHVPIETRHDGVLTRHENGWDASDKSTRRQFVASSYRILLLVGDNFEDFVAGTRASIAERAALMQKYGDYWGTKWIVLPNPTYGSWEQAITLGLAPTEDAAALARKYAALDTKR